MAPKLAGKRQGFGAAIEFGATVSLSAKII
jgi:hypothetical protein